MAQRNKHRYQYLWISTGILKIAPLLTPSIDHSRYSRYTLYMFRPDPFLNPASYILLKSLPLLIMAVLIFNMIQRVLWKGWGKKRSSSFYSALLITSLLAAAALIMRFKLNDLLLIPVILGIIFFIMVKRKILFPYKTKCIQCGNPLSIKRIIAIESNLCRNCESDSLNSEDNEKEK
ncbi:MAG: hypothetical protein JXB88_06855 [Spirochaetales bacterium]|nr:hypothetical protein [Spirochaetales bacterium]